ncbi:FecCD family ABC transporter permease [Haloglycomyces albus]|uniref:FecCD family ABC transporter permease n=1 Tax=Haloglycomyces albus TaxID=526067 RepID=UPI0004B78AF8|nr:iron chelate uptake ABC transporter family permease subunit [Haloglycomyces albus]
MASAPCSAGHRELKQSRRITVACLALLVGLILSILHSVAIGPAGLSVSSVWHILIEWTGISAGDVSALHGRIVWELRLPRVLTAGVVGAGLALTGAVMQSLTRNPMADPYLFGVSSGASLGAVAVIVVGVGSGLYALTAGAFLGAITVFSLVILFSLQRGALAPGRMILAGIALSQFCGAITTFIIIWEGNPQATQSIIHWLSGSLSRARWESLGLAFTVFALVGIITMGHAKALDAFAFGEETAVALGVSVHRTRWLLLVAGALLTATLVSISGAIGFVGLILPHAVRLFSGPSYRRLLPIATMVGAIFMIWVDTVARTVFEPREIPVGVITAVIGVPMFILLMARSKRLVSM